MSFKKAVKKIAAVATGAALVGTTLAGALAVDLSDYPAPFVEDGVFNGLIVVGATAQPADVLGSIDIAAALQAASVTTVEMEGSSTSSTVSGDVVKIEGGSDILELGEEWTQVLETLDDGDLDALSSGVISTSEGTTTYDQYLDLQAGPEATFTQSDGDLNDDMVGDFFYIPGGQDIFRYRIIYNDGLESDIDADTDTLEDFEDEMLYLFGNSYSVAKAEIEDAAPADTSLTLELLRGDFSDTLQEGETQVYELDGVEYEVTVLAIDDGDSEVMFLINGEVSDQLAEGDTDTLDNGIEIGVRNVVVNEAEETTGGDLVEFYLGSEKITLYDDDVSAVDTDGYIKFQSGNNDFNDDDQTDIEMEGTVSGSSFELRSITYTMGYDSDLYLGPGDTVRDAIAAEDEDDLGMLWFDNLDFLYEGLTEEQTTMFEISPSGDDKYNVEFVNTEGDDYSIRLVENNDGTIVMGDNDKRFYIPIADDIVNATGAALDDDDYFLLNDDYDTDVDRSTVTRIVEVDDFDDNDDKVTFKDAETGTQYTGTYTMGANAGAGTVNIGSTTYDFVVNASEDGVNYFDFNDDNTVEDLAFAGNGQIASGGYSVVTPFVQEGGLIVTIDPYLGNTTGDPSTVDFDDGVGFEPGALANDENVLVADANDVLFNVTFDYDGDVFDTEPAAGDVVVFHITEDAADDEVDLGFVSSTNYLLEDPQTPEDMEDYDVAMDTFGTLYEIKGDADDADKLTLTVPRNQREAQVFVVASETTVRKKSVGGTYEIVNPLPPGFSVLDSDIELGDANMIVVGGPCVNTIAASLLDSPEPCWDGFEQGKARIELYNVEDTYALLVAGYGPQDTRGAAYVLADYESYDLMGDKAEVVVTSLDDIDVMSLE